MFVVSLPYAIGSGGYWGFASMMLVAYICCYTGKILIDCLYDDDDDELIDVFQCKLPFKILKTKSKRRHRIRHSYVDIATDVWGRSFGARIVGFAQNIELLMTCILYLVLCGDLFVGTFPNLGLNHSIWTTLSCMVLIPCAFIRSLKFVSKLSFYNAIVHVLINAIIVIYCFTKITSWDFSKIEISINIWTFPISLGIIVFSYTSQIFLPTMEGSMIDRTKFDSMLDWTHLAAALFKSFFGLIGFLTWQEETKDVITNNLTYHLKVIVNLILIVKALLSYPLPFFASVELLESSLFLNERQQMEDSETMERKRKKSISYESTKPLFMLSCYNSDGDLKYWAILLRIALILFTLFLAIYIPHFAILMGLIGSITGTSLSLIWPCYFHLYLKRKTLKWYEIAIDVLIILIGFIITVTGIFYSAYALVRAFRNEESLMKPSNYLKKNHFFELNEENITSPHYLLTHFNHSLLNMKP